MNPNFGTIIWNVLHEPLTDDLKSVITSDVNSIVKYDPRIRVENVVVTSYERGIQLEIEMRYIQNNMLDSLILQFDSQSSSLIAV